MVLSMSNVFEATGKSQIDLHSKCFSPNTLIPAVLSKKVARRPALNGQINSPSGMNASGPKITFGKIEFPELDHLPEAEREVLLRAALESPKIQAFRSNTKKVIGMVFYSTAAIFISIAIFTETSFWLLALTFATGTIVTFVATVFIRIRLEINLVRRILNETLASQQKMGT
jgi:hypothetical protein